MLVSIYTKLSEFISMVTIDEKTTDGSKEEKAAPATPVVTHQVVEVVEEVPSVESTSSEVKVEPVIEKKEETVVPVVEKVAETVTPPEVVPVQSTVQTPVEEVVQAPIVVEPKIETPVTPVVEPPKEEVIVTPSSTERQKEVVKELFKKKDALFESEISIHEKKPNKSIILWVVIVLTVAFLVSGGLILMFGGSMPSISLPKKAEVTPTSAPVATVEPTKPPVTKKDLKIQVLNGSGTKGTAGKMKDLLESNGYVVSDTGNASTFDYKETEVSVKEGKETFAETLKTEISKEYTASVSAKKLDASSSYDIRVTVGKK